MFMYINNFKVIYTHNLFFQNALKNLSSLIIYAPRTLPICHHVNKWCSNASKPNKSFHPIALQQTHTVYWSGLNIGIWALQENSAHRKIRESLLGSAGLGRCPGLINRCKFWLSNKQAEKYISDTELELNKFHPLPFGEIVWHLSTQVNDSDISAYISVFEPRRDKRRRFIPFMVYALVYPSIASNLMTLATLSPWSDSIWTHTCYHFLMKPLLRWHRMVETRILINW